MFRIRDHASKSKNFLSFSSSLQLPMQKIHILLASGVEY